MFSVVVQVTKKAGLIALLFSWVFISSGFKLILDDQDWLTWSNKLLSLTYDPSSEKKLKKWDISITSDAFLRIRKTYRNKKQVYYSLNLKDLKKVNYLGSASKGTLQLKTKADDIIVQTRNDRRGDLDKMASELDIPVRHVGPGRLDSLKEALNYFKGKSESQ